MGSETEIRAADALHAEHAENNDPTAAARRLMANWPEDDRTWLSKFLEVIRDRHRESVKDVVIYGSMARGDWHKDSDIDVLIVLDDAHESEEETIEWAGFGLSVEYTTLPSIFSMTETKWAAEAGTSFHTEVSRDGVKVL